MQSAEATGTYTLTYTETPTTASTSVTAQKNGSVFLQRFSTGTVSGSITTGDTFSVSLTSPITPYRYLQLSSSLRGVLYVGELEPGVSGTLSSGTFTKIDNENISINAINDAT